MKRAAVKTRTTRPCVKRGRTSGPTMSAWSACSVATALVMARAAVMRARLTGTLESESLTLAIEYA